MKRQLAALCALALTVAGCETIPKETVFEKSKMFSAPKDIVWEKVIQYFAERNIPIKTIEKASGIVYAERTLSFNQYNRADTSYIASVADCGSGGPLAPTLAHSIDMNVFVRSTGTDSTSVTVNARFHETRRVVTNGGWATDTISVECLSTGKLEADIFGAIDSK